MTPLRQRLPAAVLRAIGELPRDEPSKFAAFGVAIAAMRDDAVKARKESGVEDIWMACEEAYHGLDEKNRSQWLGMAWFKPTTMAGGLQREAPGGGTKSTAFVRVTSRYVDAGAAKIGEITLPIDGEPFKLSPTPIPDLLRAMDDERPVTDPATGQPAMRPPGENEDVPPNPDGSQPQEVPVKVKDVAAERVEEAEEAAKRASKRIHDWMVECKHVSQMRKVEFDMARLGCGVLKGPVPYTSRKRSVRRKGGNVVQLEIVQQTKPRTLWVDTWNFFPARDCGEDIHSGSAVFERDRISAPSLRKLIGQPGYNEAAIKRVLEEGPEKCYVDNDGRIGRTQRVVEDKRFTIWYGYCEVKRDELALYSPEQAIDGDSEYVFAICTLVNDSVIRAVLNPLDSGSFPYHVGRWRRRAGHWSGVGVAEQVYLPQRMVNGATRAMMDNAGQAAGAVTVMNKDAITPADGSNDYSIRPGRAFFMNPANGGDDVNKAFGVFEYPAATGNLMTIAEYGFKLAEESTNIPLITQGQSGDTSPQTFGAAQLQNNNANQLLRDVGFGVADEITNPLVDQCYEWLLLDPDVPDDEKGDYQVDTNAAAAMVEKAIQDLTIMQLGAMAANPAFGIDPVRWAAQMLRTKRLNPADFQFSDDERERMAKNQPPPVQVQVAQVRAQSAEKVAQGAQQASVAKIKADTDRDTVFVQAEMARSQSADSARMQELALKRDLALLDYANKREITLEQVKSDLAQTAMKLNAQIALSEKDRPGETVTPPNEPAGRADRGDSYEA